MKIHRFYAPEAELKKDIWLKEATLLHQWNNVLRFKPGQQVVLFDGEEHDRLYKIMDLKKQEAHLELITDYQRQLPSKNIYLFWSLLKKDKNEWVLQKASELGVSHFVPLLADRCDKTGFNIDRAQKIIVEAAEQCGRSDIPSVREPIKTQTALEQFDGKLTLFVCEQGSGVKGLDVKDIGLMIGPEGGWSDQEKELFIHLQIDTVSISDFTLRAETAAIASIAKLC